MSKNINLKGKFSSIFSKMNIILNQQKREASRIYFKKPHVKSVLLSLSLLFVVTVFCFQYMLISEKDNLVIPSQSIRSTLYFGTMTAAVIFVILCTKEIVVKVTSAISQPLIMIGLTLLFTGSNNIVFYVTGVITFSLGCGATFGTMINLFFYTFDMSERLITCLGLVIYIFSYSFLFKINLPDLVKEYIIPLIFVVIAYVFTLFSSDIIVTDRKPEIIPKYSIAVLIMLVVLICINIGMSSVILYNIHPKGISFYKSYYSYTFFIGFIISCFFSIIVFLFSKKSLLVLTTFYFISLFGSYIFMTFNILYNPELDYRSGYVMFRQISDVGFGFSTSLGYILLMMLCGKILDDKAKKSTLISVIATFLGFLFLCLIIRELIIDFDVRAICIFMVLFTMVFAGIFLLFGTFGYLESKNTKDSIVGEVDRNMNRYRVIDPNEVLTPKEKIVFDLLLEGMTLRQIAGELAMKYDSVNFHYKNIYRKLEVNSKIELILRYSNDK